MGFVVVNNDGGGIFHTLPVRDFEPTFTRFFATPHGLDFRKVAELYGIPFHRSESLGAFRSTLSGFLASGEPFILEVSIPREEGHARRRGLVDRIVNAFEEDKLG